MKKNPPQILSIPPYISTSWDNVDSIYLERTSGNLIIALKNGSKIAIPNLTGLAIEDIFQAHADFMEGQPSFANKGPIQTGNVLSFGFPAGGTLDNLGNFTGMLQHDIKQKDAPNLPRELLDKLSTIAASLGIEREAFLDNEPCCNCPYCQIATAMQSKNNPNNTPDVDNSLNSTENIEESDLHFRDWNITKVGGNLYNVSKPFDKATVYQVHLGKPIGCTCGKNNCEHVIAVLNS